jgi:glycosyltransferase involved in cell wall biosynthesis
VARSRTAAGEVVDLAAIYAAGHVLLHACETETFGMAVLQAFRHGLPVIAPAAMALPELVHDGENGLLFHPRDRAQAVAALMTLFDDTARRRDVATGAASTAGQYEESAMFARLVDNLQEACVGGAPNHKFVAEPRGLKPRHSGAAPGP